MKKCRHCDILFNHTSQRKRQVGGKIDECPECVEELGTEIKERIRGFVSGEGKQACIQILRFANEEDAILYSKEWNANGGHNSKKVGGMNDVKFTKIGETRGGANHEGKD